MECPTEMVSTSHAIEATEENFTRLAESLVHVIKGS